MADSALSAGPAALPQLAVTYRPVTELLPYARNARTHSEAQIAEIAGSIKAFGFTNPVLVRPDGVIIAGHGRVRAAMLLGVELVPTIEVPWLTEVQARALTLADNRLALNAGWDTAMLSAELLDLRELGAEVELLGFTEAELAAAFEPPTRGLTHPDAAPPVPEVAVSRPGDVWKLGRHRLACGDATVEGDVRRLLGDVVPALMVTDPPYGVAYEPLWRLRLGRLDAVDAVPNDDRGDWRSAYALFPGDVVYVWHPALGAALVQDGLAASGFITRAQIIWRKQILTITKAAFFNSGGSYNWQHEPCWYAVRKGRKSNWHGDRKQSTVWDIANLDALADKNPANAKTGHGTQKPVECMQRPMLNNSAPGQAVYDPFVGSGSTIIAAEQTSRACYAMDLEPRFVDVALSRWRQFTGLRAFLAGSDEGFEDVRARRAQEG